MPAGVRAPVLPVHSCWTPLSFSLLLCKSKRSHVTAGGMPSARSVMSCQCSEAELASQHCEKVVRSVADCGVSII